MFWEKFQYLSELKGMKPHAVLKELEISSGSANNWKKGTIPSGEILKKIAKYFDVSIDSLLDFEENASVNLSSKKSAFKKLNAIPQRFNSLRAVEETSDEEKLAIAKYVGCPIWWLLNAQNISFEAKETSDAEEKVIFLILDIMDGCADNDIDRAMQIQLSRVALYHLSQKGFGAEQLATFTGIDQKKLHFILTGEENRDSSLNYGLNYSDLVYLKKMTGMEYVEMFSGK
jgi:transcriptional regulator with XRE-family HTH domain